MLLIAVLVAVTLLLGSRFLRAVIPSESLLALTLVAGALLALLAAGLPG